MRRSLLFLVLAAAACGDNAAPVIEPTSAALNTAPPSTALVTLGGVQYEYGCPDFPCPVLSIVTDQINAGNWFWMPPGTFNTPAIHLVVLRTPVKLRTPQPPIVKPPIITPTPVNPSLSGPTDLLGQILPPVNQVSCGNFKLTLTSPDGGPWEFVTGNILYEYVAYNPITTSWQPTGSSSNVAFGATAWSELLAGTYRLYPPFPNLEYNAKFTANLRRGTTNVTVQHTLLCHLAPPPPPVVPPAPTLDGPLTVPGVRLQPKKNLVCTGIELTLFSPDGGPWTFISGSRRLDYYGWNSTGKFWFQTGQNLVTSLTSGDWSSLLAGTYMTDPGVQTGPYTATFTVTLGRGQFQHTVSHTLACGGEDFLANFIIAS